MHGQHYMTLIKMTRKERVMALFKPDDNGFSEWFTRDEMVKAGLDLGNNGAQRYGAFFGIKDYKWDKKTKTENTRSQTVALRMVGFRENNDNSDRPISSMVRQHYKDERCVVCGRGKTIPDHKNDLYNDPRVLKTDTQTIDDFQPMCEPCNLLKREVCNQTRQTGRRYGATNIKSLAHFGVDFIEGDETFDLNNPNAMVGTYWYDPVAFVKRAAEIYLERTMERLSIGKNKVNEE